ncbi:MAG: cytochrome C [Candidatus Hydrogenedentes bacterium]|nr:cytochrome C [Candidatus Hydrogenedentota bacterium]
MKYYPIRHISFAVSAVLWAAASVSAAGVGPWQTQLKLPEGVTLDSQTAETQHCLECHITKGITGSAIRDWAQSGHAAGNIGCETCHVPVDGAADGILKAPAACEDKRVRPKVSSRNCAVCHEQQAAQFANGKHALAWVAMNAMPGTAAMPPDIAERGCGACHSIGRDEGKCDSCHTRHLFSAAEARRPEACQTCHMGFDHPQWEMYSTSKHGTIYQLEGDKWDWNKPLGEWFQEPYHASSDTARTPSCAFCHMEDGDHGVKTAWGFLAVRLAEDDPEWQGFRNVIFQGLGVVDEKGQPTDRFGVVKAGDVARLTKEEWEAERARVQGQCAKCHGATFAANSLAQADRVLKEADRLMAEAVTVVEGLYKDGILEKPKDRPPHPDLLQFYNVENPIEQQLYVMFLEHRMRTYQGAFHMNPDYLHWYGYAEMRRDLAEITAEAKRMREEHQ